MLAISKEQIATLPTARFNGRIILIDKLSDCRPALAWLSKQQIVGIDTETRPSFRKGRNNKVSLLQVSTMDECFLFRLNITGFTEEMKRFFENPDVLKVGLSIKDDIHQLSRLEEFEPNSFLELQTYVKDYEISDNSLQKVYAIVFGQKISKSQRLTNWEADKLTEAQQAYAALDAYACIQLYTHLLTGQFDPSKSPYVAPTELSS